MGDVAAVYESQRIQDLLDNLERLEDFFENGSLCLHWVGPDGIILRANKSELSFMGYSAEEYVGRPIADFHVDRPVIEDILARLTRGETLRDYPARLRAKDGTIKHVLIDSSVHRKDGRFLNTRCFTRDVTEQRRVQEEIAAINSSLERRVQERTRELSELLEEMEAFTYTISHDLRAPLRAIRGISDVLQEDYAARIDREGRDLLTRMGSAAARMDRMIQELLDYSRLSRREIPLGPTDLQVVVGEAVESLAQQDARHRSRISIVGPLPSVRGNPVVLTHVVGNLLSNALKFVAPGVEPQVRVGAEDRGEDVRLWIADNGIGVSPEHHARIFRVFERLHHAEVYPGTGIGLAIVSRAMKRLGGRVGLDSEAGQGSRFWIELPKA